MSLHFKKCSVVIGIVVTVFAKIGMDIPSLAARMKNTELFTVPITGRNVLAFPPEYFFFFAGGQMNLLGGVPLPLLRTLVSLLLIDLLRYLLLGFDVYMISKATITYSVHMTQNYSCLLIAMHSASQTASHAASHVTAYDKSSMYLRQYAEACSKWWGLRCLVPVLHSFEGKTHWW